MGSEKLSYLPKVTSYEVAGLGFEPWFPDARSMQGCFLDASRQTAGGRGQIAAAEKAVGGEGGVDAEKLRSDLAAMGSFLAGE